MTVRNKAASLVRWVRDPRVAIVVGALLMAGSAIAAAVTWPPSQATTRPFIVGVLLMLRGVALPGIRRHLSGRRLAARRRRRPPHLQRNDHPTHIR